MKSIIQDNANITGNSKQLAILKSNFPECFDKNGIFIASKLQEIVQASGVEVSKESYGINWLGKSYARLLANQNPQTLLKANTAHNQLPDNANSQNMLIKGDNLEVLKHLVGAYREQVKMIYIDPPYNTGSDGFVYQDDRKFTVAQLSHLAGIDETEAKRILEFTQSKSNSHSAWLTFMYPRLYIAKQLLKDDGVIFISIDDNEQAQLKILCDNIFTEECFVAILPTIMNLKGNNDTFGFVDTHEYTLVYVKNKNTAKIGLFPLHDEEVDEWEEDDYGLYKRADTLRRTGQDASRESRRKGFFPIFITKNNEIYVTENDMPRDEIDFTLWPINEELKELSWSWQKSTITRDQHNLTVVNGRSGKNIYKKQRPQIGELLTKKPKSLWYKAEYSSSSATTHLKNLMKGKLFDAPKPVPYLKDVITIGASSKDNNLILDFFAGSGTTAHAVMQLNAEDGGDRRFICVQINEETDEKKEAYKAGYKSIYDITEERIKRAAVKIRADFPLITSDFGFKQFETISVFEGYLDEPEELTPNLELFDVTKLSQEDRHNLMLTWQVQDNIPLTQSLTLVDLAGYKAYQGKHILYFIEPNITLDAVIKLLEQLDNNPAFAPRRVVVLGYLLDSKIQREITEAIKHYNNRKGIELTLDIRF